MAKFVCLLVCLAVLVQTALSLKCYTCSSDKETGCLKSANPTSTPCNPAVQNFKSVCIYKHTVAKDNKIAINSSCGIIANNVEMKAASVSECIQIPGGPDVKECRVCDSELCNSAPAFSTSYLTLLFLPILYFVTRLVAH